LQAASSCLDSKGLELCEHPTNHFSGSPLAPAEFNRYTAHKMNFTRYSIYAITVLICLFVWIFVFKYFREKGDILTKKDKIRGYWYLGHMFPYLKKRGFKLRNASGNG
jgi:hypothetical protein